MTHIKKEGKEGFGRIVPLSGAGAIVAPILASLSPKEQEELYKELVDAVKTGGIDDHDGRGDGWIRLPPKMQALLNKQRGTPGYVDSIQIDPMSRAAILEDEEEVKKKEKDKEKKD